MKKMNFGCGEDIRRGWDNLDKKDFDFNKFPYPIKSKKYDFILANNVIEHLREIDKVIRELRRITKKGGVIEIIVPHCNNKGAFSDIEHEHYFNERAFESYFKKREKEFKILEIKVVPTWLGKLVTYKKLSSVIMGVIKEIKIRVQIK